MKLRAGAILGLAGLLAAAGAVAQPAPSAAPAPASSLAGIKIAVADFQRSIDFYTKLGLVLDRKPNDHEWSLKWPGSAGGPFIYMVRDLPSAQHRPPVGGGFVMISVTDMTATVARLKDAGYPDIGEPRRGPRASLLFIKDPDGNTVELIGPG